MREALSRLTVVVPVGPGDTLTRELRAQLSALPSDSEVCIVGCDESGLHSIRASLRTAAGPQWRCLLAAPGRSVQQNAGAAAATGSWLWFLHADSVLPPDTLPALGRWLERETHALGYFDLRFIADGPALMRLNTIGAWLRSRVLGLPFGDQGLLLPRSLFDQLGRFDEALSGGEDHALVWRARRAGVPLRPLRAPLYTSARKYAERGWAATTAWHLRETWRQARAFSRVEGPRSNGAIAIFVKTPGFSPIKTRLALELGQAQALQFHRLSAAAVASVAEQAKTLHGMSVYWAVAEPEPDALAQWNEFQVVPQAPGGLGERMACVHAQLVARHGFGILIGADTPQLATQYLEQARQWLAAAAPRLALGRAADGGFWLFGANIAPPLATWNAVEYSVPGTAEALYSGMRALGQWQDLAVLTDADHAYDLPAVVQALDALSGPTPEQQALAAWIHGLESRLPVHGVPRY